MTVLRSVAAPEAWTVPAHEPDKLTVGPGVGVGVGVGVGGAGVVGVGVGVAIGVGVAAIGGVGLVGDPPPLHEMTRTAARIGMNSFIYV